MTVTRVLLYEFVTGGGSWSVSPGTPPSGTLLAEGLAMLSAKAADFLALDQVEVHLLADTRLEPFWPDGCHVHRVDAARDEQRLLSELSALCDVTLVIAPEFNQLLVSRCQLVTAAGGRLISPDAAFVELATDKVRLAKHLSTAGISTPRATLAKAGHRVPPDFPFPAVLKPVDGAGSLDVRKIDSPAELNAYLPRRPAWRLEAFHEGTAASVVVLCGPRQQLICLPSEQLLSTDEQFRYLGSRWPLAGNLHQRALELAQRVTAALPKTIGLFGIDLVLGAAEDGSRDVVVEVNPRLVTSYVGLRQLTTGNLAETMLRLADGLPADVSWRDQPVEYRVENQAQGVPACVG